MGLCRDYVTPIATILRYVNRFINSQTSMYEKTDSFRACSSVECTFNFLCCYYFVTARTTHNQTLTIRTILDYKITQHYFLHSFYILNWIPNFADNIWEHKNSFIQDIYSKQENVRYKSKTPKRYLSHLIHCQTFRIFRSKIPSEGTSRHLIRVHVF